MPDQIRLCGQVNKRRSNMATTTSSTSATVTTTTTTPSAPRITAKPSTTTTTTTRLLSATKPSTISISSTSTTTTIQPTSPASPPSTSPSTNTSTATTTSPSPTTITSSSTISPSSTSSSGDVVSLSVTLERFACYAEDASSHVDALGSLNTCISSKLRVEEDASRLNVLGQLLVPEVQFIENAAGVIERCRHAGLVGSTCSLLHDAMSPKNKGELRDMLIRKALNLNVAEVIFRTLRSLSGDGLSVLDPCVHSAYGVITKLASKDPKLAIKARLVGGVKLTHQLLRAYASNAVILLPLLMATKYLAKNVTNQIMLGKDGCVATMATILCSVPKNHWGKLKFIMEILALLTKAKSNVVRLIRETAIHHMLTILDCWDKVERRHQIKLLKAILGILSHVCDSKHGRNAVVTLGGLEITQKFITSCPGDKKFDSLISSATNVFLKCVTKGELPVSSHKGAIRFKVPSGDGSPISPENSRETTPGTEVDSSDEEDEGEEEEDDEEAYCDFKNLDLAEYCPHRTQPDDLLKLASFFPELNGFVVPGGTGFMDSLASARKERGNGCDMQSENPSEMYIRSSMCTKSLLQFVKVSYPDMTGSCGPKALEPLYAKDRKVCRMKALATIKRVLQPDLYMQRVVYDLDYLLESDHTKQLITPTSSSLRILNNWDEKRVGKKDIAVNHLNFESRFESGNLRRAIQVASHEYDLILNADVNSSHHHQWFYFEVSNMEAKTPYLFNIINNEKSNSEFNFGMKPVFFSVKEAMRGRSEWVRLGTDICYHKNHYSRIPKQVANVKHKKTSNKCYYTATFTVIFPHANDVCYLAYHYPYTYTQLQVYLSKLEKQPLPPSVFYSNQVLCHTLGGNPVPLLTLTRTDKKAEEKEVMFLTARVHPGESNSSWVMQGTIDFLLKDTPVAKDLLDKYVFKIIPMLNPEGVIHGNQRCGLTDEDLNRRWRAPMSSLHPTIYNAKALLEYITSLQGRQVRVFCDYHGHSRQKNVFMYGCSPYQSWWPADNERADCQYLLLPRLAQCTMNTFSIRDCHFTIEKTRESTARVAVWRQFEVGMSYTMEASTCGCDQGPYKGQHLSTHQLVESGEGFCVALSYLDASMETITETLSSANRMEDRENHGTEVERLLEEEELNSEDELDLDLYGCC
ncbi:cytosolic carboxypeptidase 1-like isoform X3 [Oratosquilla oratoria]|uniref:cytosolic carboxypeptidase 1-like isoform X3 n=1 Tax=Oratosquilla oratoria TaxID=337810 RepID=UPI003F7572DB